MTPQLSLMFRGREDVFPRRFESKRTGKSDERNQVIVADVIKVISNNRFPVILTERKEHLETLKSLLEDKIQNLIVMKGGMGKKQRKAALNALESLPDHAEKVLLATGRYLGEGFDDERLDMNLLNK